jgi:hypothetical protein
VPPSVGPDLRRLLVGPAMTKIGQDLCAIEINVTAKMRHYKYWTLGARIGGALHPIAIQFGS